MKLGGIKPKKLFGCSLIEGNFGSGKTFGTEAETYNRCFKNPDYLVISNIPFERCDIFYNSWADFENILNHLYYFFCITNDNLKEMRKYKKILLIMDECHLYFPARKSMDKSRAKVRDKLNVVLTQCRKRNVKIDLITQRVQKTDIDFRRLAEFIYYYNMTSLFGIPINRLSIIRAGGGLSDLIGEDGTTRSSVEDIEKDIVRSGIAKHNTFYFRQEMKMKHKDRPLRKEKDLTNFICGIKPIDLATGDLLADDLCSVYALDRPAFHEKLLSSPSMIRPIVKLNKKEYQGSSIPLMEFGYRYYDYENMKKRFDFFRKSYNMQM